jgi:hypothetical protein
LICGVNEWQGGTIGAVIDGSEYEEKGYFVQEDIIGTQQTSICLVFMHFANDFGVFSYSRFLLFRCSNARNAAMTNSV